MKSRRVISCALLEVTPRASKPFLELMLSSIRSLAKLFAQRLQRDLLALGRRLAPCDGVSPAPSAVVSTCSAAAALHTFLAAAHYCHSPAKFKCDWREADRESPWRARCLRNLRSPRRQRELLCIRKHIRARVRHQTSTLLRASVALRPKAPTGHNERASAPYSLAAAVALAMATTQHPRRASGGRSARDRNQGATPPTGDDASE